MSGPTVLMGMRSRNRGLEIAQAGPFMQSGRGTIAKEKQ